MEEMHKASDPPYAYDYITKVCNKQKPHKIMRMNMFAAQDKAKRDTKYVAVKITTVQVTKLPL
jgi:hypothetical protein